jgi:hypothetical protein
MVCGSREGFDLGYVHMILYDLLGDRRPGDLTVIHGGARGVDSHAGAWARNKDILTEVFLPEWDRLGNSAGFVRNHLMVERADMVVAFWDGKSKGTKHSIDLAIKERKELHIYYPEDA